MGTLTYQFYWQHVLYFLVNFFNLHPTLKGERTLEMRLEIRSARFKTINTFNGTCHKYVLLIIHAKLWFCTCRHYKCTCLHPWCTCLHPSCTCMHLIVERERTLGTTPIRCYVLYQAVVLYLHTYRSGNCGSVLPVESSVFGTWTRRVVFP